VIDAAANPSVLAGVDGLSSSRQVVEHNLGGTMNLLEYCKRSRAGLILLSTSRVYSIAPLAALPVRCRGRRLPVPRPRACPRGQRARHLEDVCDLGAPVSLYGATKLASEALALEYGQTFDLPVFVNRCGILAGAGQFGRPDQGIFAYWINSHLRRRPLKYIGFGGTGPPGARLPAPERPRAAAPCAAGRPEDGRGATGS
jgi:CDP-paratose 2-epimerase